MRVDLNVLTHLGIGLYSNVPAVLSEAVANSWDADAKRVEVQVGDDQITISDDGHGMNLDDVNERFLRVGYQRQLESHLSRSGTREVMGRKGIGKLSLFGIADAIDVFTTDGKEQHSFRLDTAAIKKAIGDKGDVYSPEEIPWTGSTSASGTRLVLTHLRKNSVRSLRWLRQRLSRRFTVIDASRFNVLVNGDPLTLEDRGYFRHVDAIWYYGETGKKYADKATQASLKKARNGTLEFEGTKFQFSGWIGSVRERGDLLIDGESANAVSLVVRGKVAKDDILPESGNAGVFTSYLVGEITADFLGDPGLDDISTSSRQDFRQDDVRYRALISFLSTEIARIGTLWNADREERGVQRALECEPVRRWYEEQPSNIKRVAGVMFGRLNSISTDVGRPRLELIKLGILGLERLRASEALDKLQVITPESLVALGEVLSEIDDLEAAAYYQITSQRFSLVNKLEELVDRNEKEKLIQQHLFRHMWMLDPSWERDTKTEFMEKKVATAYARINEEIAKKYGDVGRVDIGYETSARRHVVVELKRPEVGVTSVDIITQVTPYMEAIRSILQESGTPGTVEAFVVLGRYPKEWGSAGQEAAQRRLQGAEIGVKLYSEILQRVHHEYADYAEARRRAGRITALIKEIDELISTSRGSAEPVPAVAPAKAPG